MCKEKADLPSNVLRDNTEQTKFAKESNEIPVVITVDGLMAILHIGRNTAYDLIHAGKIRSVRVGKQIRIPREAVIQFLAGDEN